MRDYLPPDLDQAAAVILADLTAPDGRLLPERRQHYQARMADAGVVIDDDGFCEQGFLLKRLTARAVILETAWLQCIGDLANPRLTPAMRGQVIRGASRLQADLDQTLAIIVRVRKAQGENYAPFLTAADQALADDSRADNLMMGQYGLSIPQIVRAEALGEAIYDGEFKVRAEGTEQPLNDGN